MIVKTYIPYPLDLFSRKTRHHSDSRNIRGTTANAVVLRCHLNKRRFRDVRKLAKTDSAAK